MDVKKVLLWVVLAFIAINVIGFVTQPSGPHGVASTGMYQSMYRQNQKE